MPSLNIGTSTDKTGDLSPCPTSRPLSLDTKVSLATDMAGSVGNMATGNLPGVVAGGLAGFSDTQRNHFFQASGQFAAASSASAARAGLTGNGIVGILRANGITKMFPGSYYAAADAAGVVGKALPVAAAVGAIAGAASSVDDLHSQ